MMIKTDNVVSQETNHNNYVQQNYKETIAIFESCYSLFLNAVNESLKKIKENIDEDFNDVYLRMCMKINSDLRVIKYSSDMGWYGTAFSIFREISDAYDKILLISYHPEYAIQISNGKIRNSAIRALLKKHNISRPMNEKIWGMISDVKHAEGTAVLAYGDLSKSPLIGRFIPTINDFQIEATYYEACLWIIAVTERMRYYILTKYNGEFNSPDYSKEWERLNDMVIQQLKKLKSKSL
jgi:hypothetical protein